MTRLLFFVWLSMAALVPSRDHAHVVDTFVHVVETERPLFRGDGERLRTAALLVAMGYRESTLRNDAVSETGDYCFLQIHGRPELADDLEACLRVGIAMIRESMRVCPEHPLAFYAEGPKGCSSSRAQRISRDRFALARRLLP